MRGLGGFGEKMRVLGFLVKKCEFAVFGLGGLRVNETHLGNNGGKIRGFGGFWGKKWGLGGFRGNEFWGFGEKESFGVFGLGGLVKTHDLWIMRIIIIIIYIKLGIIHYTYFYILYV